MLRLGCPFIMITMVPAQYVIPLCATAQEAGESFGLAVRIGSSAKFQAERRQVLGRYCF
jgi:hypothetical protein